MIPDPARSVLREQKDHEEDSRVDHSQYDPPSAEPLATAASNQSEPTADEDERYPGEPWCLDFKGHTKAHEFCGHHQESWCRVCDHGACPSCVDDPHCPDCGCAMFEEYHDWDCGYAEDLE